MPGKLRRLIMAKKILIVDDEPDVTMFLSTLLRKNGYETVTATDADEGLEEARVEKPDLISLDLIMSHKSGINMFQELRTNEDTSDIPVVVVTGFVKENVPEMDFIEWLQESFPKPPEAYLEKPVDEHDFLNAVKKAIG
jgi:CheY-like chemotaxis protein